MYYVLVKAGVPVDVVTQMAMAKQRARELETPGSPCTIVPVVPKGDTDVKGPLQIIDCTRQRCSYPDCPLCYPAKEKAPEYSKEDPGADGGKYVDTWRG